MVTTSDLLPFASGAASIGVNQIGIAGFGNPVPYNHIHFVSGIIHDPILGVSGIIRFAKNLGQIIGGTPVGVFRGFELSADGGNTFGLRIASEPDPFPGLGPHAVLSSQDQAGSHLYILTSGDLVATSQSSQHFLAVQEIDFESEAIQFLAQGSLPSIDFISFGTITSTAISDNDVNASRDITISAGQIDVGGQIELNAFASSGRLQYRFGPHQAWYAKLTHSNTGGPFNDGFWPLPHSGQIAQMISQATPGGSVDLQAAYDNGNEIDHRKDLVGYKGVVIRETTPGLQGFTNNSDITVNKSGKYGIAVSGHTLTPTDVNSYGFAALNSLSLVIAGSGTPTAPSRNFFLGYTPTDPELVFFNSNGSLRFAVGDNLSGDGRGGQIQFRPFGASGRMEYRFGPHQSWAARLTHSNTGGPANDGFWPLPHSGQILETIARTPKSKAITIERPAINNDLTIWYTNESIFITEVESVLRGGFDASGSFAIRHSTDRSQVGTSITTLPIECISRTTGTITTSFVSQSIPADSWLWIGVSGVSGVATSQLNVTIQYLN